VISTPSFCSFSPGLQQMGWIGWASTSINELNGLASFGPHPGHDITSLSKHSLSPSCGCNDSRISWSNE
jgi:hypothetical protein